MSSSVVSDSSSSATLPIVRTPRELFLRSARLLSDRRLPLLLIVGPFDLGLPNHDLAGAFDLDADADAVDFMDCWVYSLMKPLERRKATKVRKKRLPRRESRTILLLASLLSRRIVADCVLGGCAISSSTKAPMVVLCNR